MGRCPASVSIIVPRAMHLLPSPTIAVGLLVFMGLTGIASLRLPPDANPDTWYSCRAKLLGRWSQPMTFFQSPTIPLL